MRIPSNKIQDIIRFAFQELEGIYPKEEIRQMTNILITHYSGFPLTTILAQPTKTVLESDLLKLNFAIKDLKHEKPLQYIIEETEFYGLRIKLNHKVLIPRPETEELVDIIIKENLNKKDLKIADLGCGSGAIALALKNNLKKSKVWAYDIEDEAIEQTKENAKSLKLSIEIQKANILEENFTEEKFDIIISNPPYVMDSEKELMKPNVLNHEPHSALFVPNNDPLLFYKSIAEFAKTHLNENGKCYLEINEQLAQETLNLFPSQTTKLIKDIFSKDRFIIFYSKDI